MAKTMEQLIDSVIHWGQERNIIGGASALDQQEKLEEEVEEIRTALESGDGSGVVDGIGDTMVVLIMQASILGLRIEDCLEAAYNEIEHRKGRLLDGKFVKEEDLIKMGIA